MIVLRVIVRDENGEEVAQYGNVLGIYFSSQEEVRSFLEEDDRGIQIRELYLSEYNNSSLEFDILEEWRGANEE